MSIPRVNPKMKIKIELLILKRDVLQHSIASRIGSDQAVENFDDTISLVASRSS